MDPVAAAIGHPIDAATSRLPMPIFERHGDEFAVTWPTHSVAVALTDVHKNRDGVKAELAVALNEVEVHWGQLNLVSTPAREQLVRKLAEIDAAVPWRPMLERVCRHTVEAMRQGEPFVTLTGAPSSPLREVMPRLLYAGEPTAVIGDGDTGKSLFALAVGVAARSGAALPCGLKPVRALPVAYLDWETSRDTLEMRLALLAAGLGIDPPPITYRRMTRPLVEEANRVAAELAQQHVGVVVVDSQVFALGGGDGAAFHETTTAFYNAVRLFAPAATLVLNHVTNEDARTGRSARPFGGAFAFNGPRLIWEAKRDREVADATAIAFTCTKANNLPKLPEPFGLRFAPGAGTITVYPLDLAETAPQATAGASLSFHVRLALARGVEDPEVIAKDLAVIGKRASPTSIERILRRERQKQEPRT
jgi:hypothetical protein